MGDGEGEGNVRERKWMIAWSGKGENSRGRRDSVGQGWFPAWGDGWDSAGRKMEEGEFEKGSQLGVWEVMVRKGMAERLGEFG